MENNDIKYLINQVFEIKKKAESRDIDIFERNLSRVFDRLDEAGYKVVNPIGEKYSDTRTDLEAHITSEDVNQLIVQEVIKPIIYKNDNGTNTIVQKGVVVVG